MSRISVRHEHDAHYHVQIRTHGLVVDQPVGAGGSDLGPTPTELFVGSLVACVAYYAGRYLTRHGIATTDFRVDADFDMSQDAPSRVTAIRIKLVLPKSFPMVRLEPLRRVAQRCTVHNSIVDAPVITVTASGAEQAA